MATPRKRTALRGSGARATPDTPAPAKRINKIVELMAAGKWITGVTGVQLAQLWGLAPATLRREASEASRRLMLEPGEIEAKRWQLVAVMESAVSVAASKRDAASMTRAALGQAEILGLLTQKHEVKVAESTPAEAARLVREEFGAAGAPPEQQPPADDATGA